MSIRHGVLSVVVTLAAASCLLTSTARAERAPLSPEKLDKESTHIVAGEVLAVYSRDADSTLYGVGTVVTQMVVEIKVRTVDKGVGIVPNDVIYARCWKLKRRGAAGLTPGPSGHFDVPKQGDVVRAFLAKGRYGPTGQDDNGLTAVYPNGFDVQQPAGK